MALIITAAVLLLLVAGPVIVVNRDLLFSRGSARRALQEPPLPFLIFPVSRDASTIVPAGARSYEPMSTVAYATPPDEPEPFESSAAPIPPVSEAPAEEVRPVDRPKWPRAVPSELDLDEPPDDATMVFNRPVDEAVQILPGRLRILSGESTGDDLRLFNRLGEPPRIVVGRETGPPHQHITLHSPTVSRRHARMDFIDGHWTITNLSATNPVLVNDRVLGQNGATRKLADGDRIELGEVALRFLAS